jgi:hypothetical protein
MFVAKHAGTWQSAWTVFVTHCALARLTMYFDPANTTLVRASKCLRKLRTPDLQVTRGSSSRLELADGN